MNESIPDRNLPNTDAYLRLREQAQRSFDFAVVVCHGVPSLKLQISLLNRGEISTLPDPDYFPSGQNPPEQLREQAKGYKQTLSEYTLLSIFSFFESFVEDAIQEMIDFHGGEEEFHMKAKENDTMFISEDDDDIEKKRRRLRGKMEDQHSDRHEKYSDLLLEEGYRFPSETFSGYGVKMLIRKLDNLKAAQIPNLLVEGLHMDIKEKDIEKFHNIKHIRNKIAHGDKVSLHLRKISEYNEFLRDLAYRIDRHLVINFMVSEDYLSDEE